MLLHLPDAPYAYGIGPSRLRVVLRAPRGAISGGEVRFNDRYAWAGDDYAPLREQAPLYVYADDGQATYWAADLDLHPPRLRYRFGLDSAAGRQWFGWDGLRDEPAPTGAFEFAYLAEGDRLDAPEWARGATFYHIFVDRFARSAEPARRTGVEAWADPPTTDGLKGGDLDGIIERLDHIASLGVDALYLTPIFSAPSSHRYDTADFFSVDPDLGGNAALRRLVDALHERGMRLVLDGVFNHVGATWPPFVDALRNGRNSRYADWFYLDEGTYETWGDNVPSLPKLRTSEPEVRELVCRVGRFWVQEFGIDGWRLDVANEVDHTLWKAFRRAVREVNGEALLFGEIWDGAMPWLRGDELDSVMNYPLRRALLGYAGGKIRGDGLLAALDRLRAAYPEPMHGLLYNLIGSHDESRPLTTLGGERAALAVAAAMLYALPGIVSIYYGDEVGMSGGKEPANRAAMIWSPDGQDARMLELFRRLGRLRRERPVLRHGTYERVAGDGELAVIARASSEDRVIVLANAGHAARSVSSVDLRRWLVSEPAGMSTFSYSDSPARTAAGSLELPAQSVTFVFAAGHGSR